MSAVTIPIPIYEQYIKRVNEVDQYDVKSILSFLKFVEKHKNVIFANEIKKPFSNIIPGNYLGRGFNSCRQFTGVYRYERLAGFGSGMINEFLSNQPKYQNIYDETSTLWNFGLSLKTNPGLDPYYAEQEYYENIILKLDNPYDDVFAAVQGYCIFERLDSWHERDNNIQMHMMKRLPGIILALEELL